MFDFSKVNGGPVNRDYVLSKVSEGQIFYQYFGEYKFGDVYHSKFRKDRNPSAGIYMNRDGRLRYSDFKTGEKHDCFSFVAKLYNITYSEAIRKVAAEFGLIESSSYSPLPSSTLSNTLNFDTESKKENIIQIVPAKWNENALRYWRLYEIDKEELIRERVYPIKELFLNKRLVHNRDNELRFAYIAIDDEGKEYIKVYSPFSKTMKWLSNIPLTLPFGLNDLKYESDTVIITKSKKDLIVLKKLFSDVIATQNESESALTAELVGKLTSKFDRRIIIWDNDETGVTNCTKFNTRGFGYFNIPKREYETRKIKDVSDYVKWYGVDALRDILQQKGLL